MEWTISKELIYEAMYKVLVKATTILPQDILAGLATAKENEESELARLHLETSLENAALVEREDRIVCSDTGWPMYYVRIGDGVRVEGGYSYLYQAARLAVNQASINVKLRPTLVHPLTLKNPGNNIGPYFPKVEIRFDSSIDFMDIIFVPKGGGAEIFGSSFRMLVAADGIEGVKKFVLDSVVQSSYAGKTCPPNIIGVGIGGTADTCMKMAKEACVLRPIGSRHPESDIAQLEIDLLETINSLGIGPMGSSGKTCALDVHVEYAMTHTAALAVAVNTQCSMARRAVVKIDQEGFLSFSDQPDWIHRGVGS